MFPISKVNILADSTLTSLMNNNRKILETRIKKQTIRRLVKALFSKERHQKYAKMLQTLVNCNGKAIVSNQAECCLQIFEHKHVWRKLIFKTRKNSGGIIEVYVPDYSTWIAIEHFYRKSDIKDNLKIYNYFTSMVLLCSDLCLDRNFIEINH